MNLLKHSRAAAQAITYHNGIYRITIPKDIPVNKIYIKKAIEIIDKLEAEKK